VIGPAGLRRRLRLYPREDALVDRARPLEVQEVTRVFDDLETRAGCEVALGVADEADVEAAVAVTVQIERRLWRGPEQRFVLGGNGSLEQEPSAGSSVGAYPRMNGATA
jgi:hypothetical protein